MPLEKNVPQLISVPCTTLSHLTSMDIDWKLFDCNCDLIVISLFSRNFGPFTYYTSLFSIKFQTYFNASIPTYLFRYGIVGCSELRRKGRI